MLSDTSDEATRTWAAIEIVTCRSLIGFLFRDSERERGGEGGGAFCDLTPKKPLKKSRKKNPLKNPKENPGKTDRVFQLSSRGAVCGGAEEDGVRFRNLHTRSLPPLHDEAFAHHLLHRHLGGVVGEVYLSRVRTQPLLRPHRPSPC